MVDAKVGLLLLLLLLLPPLLLLLVVTEEAESIVSKQIGHMDGDDAEHTSWGSTTHRRLGSMYVFSAETIKVGL